MAAREETIRTRLTLDGEKEFKRGINSINQELRLSNAQLKEVAATYDLNGNAQDRLTAKSRILREQVAAQNRIVQQYEERMRQAEQATDLSAEGLRGYSIQLTNARTKAKQLEKELADTDRELEELGRDSRRAGDQLENNLGEAAEETESKLQKLARSVNDTLGGMKKLQRVSVAVDIVRGAWDIAESLTNYVQGAVDDGMSRAITAYNITARGGDLSQGMGVANRYAAIFGDREAAQEAVNNLVAAGYKDAALETMGNYIGGIVLALDKTLKVEAISEEIRKYIKSGETGGQLDEAISYTAGLSEDDDITVEGVKRQLAAPKTEKDRMEALNAYFMTAGLDTYYEDFAKQNEGLVESATALQEFNTALNDLAVTTLPLLTPAVKGLTDVITEVQSAIQSFTDWITEKFGRETPNVTYEQFQKLFPQSAEKISQFMQWYGEAQGNAAKRSTVGSPWELFLGGREQRQHINDLIARNIAGATDLGPVTNNPFDIGFNKAFSAPEMGISTRTGKGATGQGLGINNAVEEEMNAATETATTGGKAIGSGLVTGLQSQYLRLLAAAAQQRALLERVWEDPIKPTVVVGYQMAGPVNKNWPNVNVTINPADVIMDTQKVARMVFPGINSLFGRETGE